MVGLAFLDFDLACFTSVKAIIQNEQRDNKGVN